MRLPGSETGLGKKTSEAAGFIEHQGKSSGESEIRGFGVHSGAGEGAKKRQPGADIRGEKDMMRRRFATGSRRLVLKSEEQRAAKAGKRKEEKERACQTGKDRPTALVESSRCRRGLSPEVRRPAFGKEKKQTAHERGFLPKQVSVLTAGGLFFYDETLSGLAEADPAAGPWENRQSDPLAKSFAKGKTIPFKLLPRPLFEKTKTVKSPGLSALINIIQARGGEIISHMVNMQRLAAIFSSALGLTEKEQKRLLRLICLHDIGKIYLPRRILTKKGPLTAREWALIKTHPQRGYHLACLHEKSAAVAEEILCHHEHWDGSGYPHGRCQEEIPFLSRVVALLDACEVMGSGRPYKRAMTYQEMKDELERCAGTQFDPVLTRLFVAVLEKKRKKAGGSPR